MALLSVAMDFDPADLARLVLDALLIRQDMQLALETVAPSENIRNHFGCVLCLVVLVP